MLLLKGHYADKQLLDNLVLHLASILKKPANEPVFLGIGSDRYILDCLGPLVGSMLTEKTPSVLVYGTLDDPLNAKNLNKRLELIKERHEGSIMIAIDASLGPADDWGMIKLFQGALQPGKAVSHKLEPVGHFYITGIVARQEDRSKLTNSGFGSLSHVYHMARLISEAINSWHIHYYLRDIHSIEL